MAALEKTIKATSIFSFFAVQYVAYMCRYMLEWRKNPQWSLSCCLALLLPLNDLQGEIRGLAGRSILKQQLQTGKVDMPSMSGAFKDSGAVTFDLEGGTDIQMEGRNSAKNTNASSEETEALVRRFSWAHQSDSQLATCSITIHADPGEMSYHTSV